MGPAGAGSLAQVINAALASRGRFDRMRDFFEGVGQADNAGIWEGVPADHSGFREGFRKQLERQAKSTPWGRTWPGLSVRRLPPGYCWPSSEAEQAHTKRP
jgi:hypothetical protein